MAALSAALFAKPEPDRRIFAKLKALLRKRAARNFDSITSALGDIVSRFSVSMPKLLQSCRLGKSDPAALTKLLDFTRPPWILVQAASVIRKARLPCIVEGVSRVHNANAVLDAGSIGFQGSKYSGRTIDRARLLWKPWSPSVKLSATHHHHLRFRHPPRQRHRRCIGSGCRGARPDRCLGACGQ
ncbi:hypothetical protein [Neorhizobium sp. DT-125]|uniref:hypothetical protein n=1 Tax=Neorhizobium sp. DT-125 TaxID=3396163 RepID=UPI003F540C7E